MTKKIIHLLTSDKFSGAENVVCQIIEMFKNDENYEMIYCSPDGKIRESLIDKDITFLPLRKLSIGEVKKAIDIYKPDIIHAHDIKASVISTIIARETSVVSHLHIDFPGTRKGSIKSILYLICSWHIAHIFWVSEPAMKNYRYSKKISSKSSVLSNVIDIDSLMRKVEQDNNSYHYDGVYLGRITYQKDPERLVKVLNGVTDILPDVKIAIIGDGDLRQQTEKQVKEYNIDDNIDFLGFQHNPYKLLYDAKVMVLTSRHEGMPIVVLEAMALGVPIVAVPIEGLEELIVNGFNGYLSDDNDMLAKYIAEIIQDKIKHQVMSDAAKRRFMAMNDLNEYKEALKKVYFSVTGLNSNKTDE